MVQCLSTSLIDLELGFYLAPHTLDQSTKLTDRRVSLLHQNFRRPSSLCSAPIAMHGDDDGLYNKDHYLISRGDLVSTTRKPVPTMALTKLSEIVQNFSQVYPHKLHPSSTHREQVDVPMTGYGRQAHLTRCSYSPHFVPFNSRGKHSPLPVHFCRPALIYKRRLQLLGSRRPGEAVS